MQASFFPATAAAELPPSSILPSPADVSCSAAAQQDVGAGRHIHCAAEERLDAHIRALGTLSAAAMKDGDPTGSRIWSKQMHDAIASRSPEHQARLIAENERRIDEGTDYMQGQGRLAAELLAKRGAVE